MDKMIKVAMFISQLIREARKNEEIGELKGKVHRLKEELEKNEDLKSYLEESSKTDLAIKLIVDNAKIAKK